MAKPLSPSTMLQILKDEGLKVREYTGWRDRCRCHNGSHENGVGRNSRAWGDVNGTVVHITAGNKGKRTVQQYIRDIINGDPNVPTKSQFVVDTDGTVWLNSVGRCNHVGTVGAGVKAKLIRADFSLTKSVDQSARGNSADGNAFTYGIENIAATRMTDAQREASVKICAAIARHYGWTGQESIGHGEVSSQRTAADPNLHMGNFRRDVMARVKAGAKPTEKPKNPVVSVDYYVVQPGDTLTKIAQRYKVTVEQLVHWNNLTKPDFISVGQKLNVRAPKPAMTYHVVARGETLSGIAKRHKTTVDALVKLNKINNPNVIKPGQRLRVK